MTRYFLFALLAFAFVACQQSREKEMKLFSLIEPNESGIEFSNDLTFDADFNIYTYRNYYNGGGVAVADFNNDNLIDIYFTANSKKNQLYLNKGNFKFEDITESAGVGGNRAWSTGVSIADVNADGFLDIYVCNSGDIKGDNKQNELFINNGDLTFTERAEEFGLADQGYSTHAAFFDYDKDGDLDAYLLNNSYQAIGSFNLMNNIRDVRDSVGGDKLYRNDGGFFTDVSEEAGIYGSVIGFGLGVTVGDVNNDNWLDIFVSNDFFERDYLYINQKDGTFKESVEEKMASLSAASMGADMADINNDLKADIFVTDMLPEPDERIKQVTMFESWDKYQYKLKTDYYHQFSRNMLHINNGDGSFMELARFAGVEATDWSWGALIFDMNNDGNKDLFVANGIYQDITDLDYLNFIADDETKKRIITKEGVDFKALVDPIPINPISNYAFKNNGDLDFQNATLEWGLDQKSHSNGSAYADLDNDGDLDLIVNNVNANAFVYRNNTNSSENHFLRFKLIGDVKNTNAIGAKIFLESGTNQFYLEHVPIRGFQSTVDHRLTFGVGKITEIEKATIVWPDDKITILENLSVDQEIVVKMSDGETLDQNPGDELTYTDEKLFKAIAVSGIDFKHEESNFVDFDRDRLTYYMRSNEGPALATADFNGDGLDDIFMGGAKGQSAMLYIQSGGGSFQGGSNPFEDDKKSEDVVAHAFDADSDGDIDLYVGSGSSEFGFNTPELIDRLYINDGNGNFTKSVDPVINSLRNVTSCVVSSDIDGDGDLDLFTGARMIPFLFGAPANGVILLNDGQGNFSFASESMMADFREIGMITDAVFTDIDGDKNEDLLIVGEYMNIKVFKNTGAGFQNITEKSGVSEYFGWWHVIHPFDLDKDGDMDFIVGNHGLNSRFKVDLENPMNLYVYDFDNNGTVEHIFSRYVDGKEKTLALKQDLVMQMPSLKKKFVKFSDYSNKNINEIFDSEILENKALKLKVNWFYTSILRNDGSGNFSVEPIEGPVQYSPTYAIASVGNDKGGVVLGGNQLHAKPQVGIYNANKGLYYRNINSTLEYVPNIVSGLNINSEVRNISNLIIQDKESIVFGISDNSPVVYTLNLD